MLPYLLWNILSLKSFKGKLTLRSEHIRKFYIHIPLINFIKYGFNKLHGKTLKKIQSKSKLSQVKFHDLQIFIFLRKSFRYNRKLKKNPKKKIFTKLNNWKKILSVCLTGNGRKVNEKMEKNVGLFNKINNNQHNNDDDLSKIFDASVRNESNIGFTNKIKFLNYTEEKFNMNFSTSTSVSQVFKSSAASTVKNLENINCVGTIKISENNLMGEINKGSISGALTDDLDVISSLIGAGVVHNEYGSNSVIASTNSVSNGIVNGNATNDGINSFYFYETEQLSFLCGLFAVIVLGNLAVLVTMFMNKNRKSRMNFFIKQLAFADLFVGLLNVLTDIVWRITVSWRAGNLACKIIRSSQVCVTYGSTYVLVALSIDRYDAITHPMNFSGSWKRARILVISAWVVSALFSAPMLFLFEERSIEGQIQCWIELGDAWRWQIYMTLVSLTLLVFPALIISACYAIIVRTIWVKGSLFIATERNAAARRASSRGIIPRAKVKTVKMTFVIVIVFVVCWSPYIIFDLLQVYGQIPRTQTNIAIATFIQSLAPLNSAANPLIYCLFSTQICRTLRRIPPFRWFLCCCGSKGHGRTSINHHHHHHHRCTNTIGQNRLHNSCDSMRTLTTSLTTSSRRSNNNCIRPAARVVIVERPKSILAMSEV